MTVGTHLLTPRWHPMKYHPEQIRLWTSKKKYKAVVAGRGSGKTEIARRYLVMKALEKKPWPDPKYFFLAPTTDQARRVAWKDILALIPPQYIDRKNSQTLFIQLTTGAEIHLCSGEKPHRLEGVQWDGGVIDESSDQKPGIFDLNLGPAMTHRDAWCWRIGVPKRRGIGAKEFKEFWDRGMDGDKHIDSFHWKSEDILDEDTIAMRKASMAMHDYEEQYLASWSQTIGLAYPDFGEQNITTEAIYHPSMPIYVGSDFNVNPMAWVLAHKINGRLYQFDEVWLRHTNTRKTLDHLAMKYGSHAAGWHFIGDASSKARKTSASDSDYIQIQNDTRFSPKKMKYPSSNPPIKDRLATMNAAILNAAGERRYFVHPDCKQTIMDLENRHYKEAQLDKPSPEGQLNDFGDLGHITDALGYLIWAEIPMRVNFKSTGKVIIA